MALNQCSGLQGIQDRDDALCVWLGSTLARPGLGTFSAVSPMPGPGQHSLRINSSGPTGALGGRCNRITNLLCKSQTQEAPKA